MIKTAKTSAPVYNAVLEEIERRITAGELKPGMKLPSVKDLAAELGVGQSSVREAIRVLASMGVLQVEHGRGTFIAPDPLLASAPSTRLSSLEQQSVVTLTEVRRILEPELAARAAVRATPDEIAVIVRTAREMADLAAAGEDFLDPDLRFHEAIVHAAKNSVLERVMAVVYEDLFESRRITVRIPGMDREASQAHLNIATAILERDPERARTLMQAHMDSVIDALSRGEEYQELQEALQALRKEPLVRKSTQ